MLDLIISYVNFLILSLGYIVKRFTFFPPNPPHYKSIQCENENEESILFLIHLKKKKPKYIGIEFRLLDYRFIKLLDKNNNSLPLLLFQPPSHLSVCIIYSHGNSGDLGSCLLEYYDIALNTNCLVVSFEYPGYGECINQPKKESEFFKNLKMTYFFVKKVLKYKPSQIILYGFSLGTGIMFDIACKKDFPAAGLILQSPFLSILRTLYDIKPTYYFDLFNNCDKAKYLKIKTLFIHGNKDHMVPYIHGRILSKLIPQQYFYDFLTVDKADHNNIFKGNRDLIYKKIRQFIKDCTGKFSDFNKKKINIEKNNLEDSETTLYNNSDNGYKNTNTNEEKKINQTIDIKLPTTNNIFMNNKCQNININSLFNNELSILMNNRYYNNYNNNFYHSKFYNTKSNHNQNMISEQNYPLYNRNRNYIYSLPNFNNLNGNKLQNFIFNINNLQDNFNNQIPNQINGQIMGSSINNLNNSEY